MPEFLYNLQSTHEKRAVEFKKLVKEFHALKASHLSLSLTLSVLAFVWIYIYKYICICTDIYVYIYYTCVRIYI
jgi:hypothetical protein